MTAMAPQAIASFLDKFGHHMPIELRDGLDYAVANFPHTLRAYERLPDQTLCHIDAHLGNIAFENGRARFFDWQAFMICPGSFDMALAINANLLAADRRAALPELLNTYHEALIKGGVADFSRRDVENLSHRQAAHMWVLMPLLAGAFLGSDERSTIFAATWLPRIFSALVDCDAPKQLGIWLKEIGM